MKFMMPNKVIMGYDILNSNRNLIKRAGKKAFVVTDDIMIKLGNLSELEMVFKDEKIDYVVYSEVNSEPTDNIVEKGLEIYKDNKCDFICGLGGGSVLDTMKAIGALATNPGKIVDYMGKEISNATPNLIAIPTTAGTGSEATQFTIITDTKNDIKMLLKGSVLIPDLAIIDAKFTVSAPPKVTAATGLDALTHAIEAYTSRKANELSDMYAIAAVKKIFKYLPAVYRNGADKTAREEMSMAAFEAGVAFNNSSVTVVHGMSRPIGALFHISHGMSNALLLNVCLKYVLDGAYDRFAYLGKLIGVAAADDDDKTASENFLQAVSNICSVCEIKNLSEYGVDKEKFLKSIDKMSADAIESGSPSNTRKKLSKEDIVKIYKALWN